MSKIKICGLSRIEDIETVNRTLPDFIGFVFAPSRRKVDITTAAVLKEKLNPHIEAVGVFVNENINVVTEICRKGIINIIQLHGDEDDEYIRCLKESCTCPVIKAIGVGDMLPSLPLASDYVLFDTLSERRGGIGKTFEWSILNEYNGLPFFLAGGLSVENAADAIRLLKPFCVDISSGVETDGLKDAEKIEKIISLVRGINE